MILLVAPFLVSVAVHACAWWCLVRHTRRRRRRSRHQHRAPCNDNNDITTMGSTIVPHHLTDFDSSTNDRFDIFVRAATDAGKTYVVSVCNNDTVHDLKAHLEALKLGGDCWLTHQSKVLDDDRTLARCGIHKDSHVHQHMRGRAGSSPSTTKTTTNFGCVSDVDVAADPRFACAQRITNVTGTCVVSCWFIRAPGRRGRQSRATAKRSARRGGCVVVC